MKNNWQTKKLGDIIQLEYGKPLPDIDRNSKGKYPVYGANGIKNWSNKYYHDNPSIIVGRKGSAGEVNLTKDKFWPLDVTYYVTYNRKDYDLKFLYNLLLTLNLPSLAKGVKPGINRNEVYAKSINVPTSLSEQKRIVKILDEAFEKIEKAKENAEKNLQNSRELFKGYLNNAYASLDKDWERKKLGDIGKVSMCKRVFKEQTTKMGDIPFYKIGTFGRKPDAFISKEIYNEFRVKFPYPKKGDILISASGTIGRRVRYDGEPAYFQDSNIVWIDNNEKQVLNDYLYYFYGGCDWNLTKGATISRLYNDNLRQIQISFPKSFEEQKQIVKKLDALSEQTKNLESIYQQKLADLEELKNSILQKAFNGEL